MQPAHPRGVPPDLPHLPGALLGAKLCAPAACNAATETPATHTPACSPSSCTPSPRCAAGQTFIMKKSLHQLPQVQRLPKVTAAGLCQNLASAAAAAAAAPSSIPQDSCSLTCVCSAQCLTAAMTLGHAHPTPAHIPLSHQGLPPTADQCAPANRESTAHASGQVLPAVHGGQLQCRLARALNISCAHMLVHAGQRAPAGRQGRANAARQVLPAVHGGQLQEGPAGADVPRDPALQSGLCGAAAQKAGHRRPGASLCALLWF